MALICSGVLGFSGKLANVLVGLAGADLTDSLTLSDRRIVLPVSNLGLSSGAAQVVSTKGGGRLRWVTLGRFDASFRPML